MPLIFAGDRLILFAHVPKTGGTSLERYFQARFGPDAVAFLDHSWRGEGLARRSLASSPQHILGEDLRRLLPDSRLHWRFAVVRDPAARAVSEYLYQFRPEIPLRSPWRRRLARLGFPIWLAMALRAARRDPLFLDNHLRPQVDLVPEGCEVFRLEDGLEAVIARLDCLLGETAPELHLGRELRGETTRPAPSLSRQDLALIAAAYASDYVRFGYAPPDLAAAPSDPFAWARHAFGRLLAPFAVQMYRRGRM